MRETQAPGVSVAFSVRRKRLQGVTTLKSRIKQGQLSVFTSFALRNSHRLGVPLGGEGTGRGLQVQGLFISNWKVPYGLMCPYMRGVRARKSSGINRRVLEQV
jgi:hypothetical protein